LRDELSTAYSESEIEMIESSGGAYNVYVNNDQIFDKIALDRFPNDGEILVLVERFNFV
jgi:tryptophanase